MTTASAEATVTDTKKRTTRKKRSEVAAPKTEEKGPATGPDLDDVRARWGQMVQQMSDSVVDREESILAMCLAALTGQHYLLIGEPGTAKTMLARMFKAHITGATYFETTVGTFTPLDELIGPPDIKAFQGGEWARSIDGRLCSVEIAFLDEAMKGNEHVLNQLLTILNERRYEGASIPLRTCGAATNWPEVRELSDKVEALYDRFLIRRAVRSISGLQVLQMVRARSKTRRYAPQATVTLAELDAVREHIRGQVDAGKIVGEGVVLLMESIRARCRKSDVRISDRRFNHALDVVAAHAWMHGRDEATADDLDALRFVFWNQENDLEVLEGVLATRDQAFVAECVKYIDDAREEYKGYSRLSPSSKTQRRPQVITKMKKAAISVLLRVAPDRAYQFAAKDVVDQVKKDADDACTSACASQGRLPSPEDLLCPIAITEKGMDEIRKALEPMKKELSALLGEGTKNLKDEEAQAAKSLGMEEGADK